MRLQSLHPRRRTAAAVAETAIVLPFLAFLFLVALDFCRVFYTTQTVEGCAQAAVLYASGTASVDPATTPQDAAVQAALAEGASLDPPLRPENVAVTVANNTATVTVTYNFQTITGYPGVPSSLNVVRTATLRVAPKVGDGP